MEKVKCRMCGQPDIEEGDSSFDGICEGCLWVLEIQQGEKFYVK